jgi:predicted nucleotidyltransferase
MDRLQIIERLTAGRDRLSALGVTRLFLFGSVARNEAGAASDVDIMVDLDEGPDGRKPLFSAFDVGGIQYELAEMLGRPVDLVVRSDALKPGAKLGAVARDQLVDVF